MSTYHPTVPKARKSLTRLNSIHSSVSSESSVSLLKPEGPTPQSTQRKELVHVVEVYNSKTKLIVSSEEEDWSKTKEKRKKRPKTAGSNTKKKFRGPKKGNETDTLSEIDSGSEIIPVVHVRKSHRPPKKGSATDTLSEVSDGDTKPEISLLVPQLKSKHRAPRRGSITDTLSEESDDGRTVNKSEHKEKLSLAPSQPPVSSPASEKGASISQLNPISRIPRPVSAQPPGSSKPTPVQRKINRSSKSKPVPAPRLSVDNTIPTTTGDNGEEVQSNESSQFIALPSVRDEILKSASVESLPPQPPKRSKKPAKKKKSPPPPPTPKPDESNSEINEATCNDHNSPLPSNDNDLVIITIHGSDPLKFLDFARNPLVRVHAVDCNTGESLITETKLLQTKPFRLKINRTVTPCWEEDLIIREPLSQIASKQCLLLFEVIESTSSKKERIIAWAFLKLIALNGASNLSRLLRLQLYKPNSVKKKNSETMLSYQWWLKGKYALYKSTLYVSVNPIPRAEIEETPPSPQGVTNTDGTARITGIENARESINGMDEEEEEVVWTRLYGQSCKLPNTIIGRLICGRDGSQCLAFSHNGRCLAAPTNQSILIYDFPSLRLTLTLYNHSGIVHDLCWSDNDELLISASADATACVWAIKRKLAKPLKVLSHPTYVYCCCWMGDSLVATGCLDGHIRLWSLDSDNPPEFLSRHRVRVNSLASCPIPIEHCDDEGCETDSEDEDYKCMMISGDSSGCLILWKENPDSKKYEMAKELKVREIQGQVVNKIVMVPGGKRILIQTKDSLIRMIDISTSAVLQYYQGGVSVKTSGSIALCGCGRRVWSWSEDGCLVVWDYSSGVRLAVYSNLKGAIALHPFDNIIAVVQYCPNTHPNIIVSIYDREGDGTEVGLITLDPLRREGMTKSNQGLGKWSAMNIPLHPIPSVKIQPPPGLRFSKSSRSSSPRPGSVSPIPHTKMTRAFSGEIQSKSPDKMDMIQGINSFNKPPLILENGKSLQNALTPRSADVRDTRLSDIIDKMDMLLLQASPKQRTSVI